MLADFSTKKNALLSGIFFILTALLSCAPSHKAVKEEPSIQKKLVKTLPSAKKADKKTSQPKPPKKVPAQKPKHRQLSVKEHLSEKSEDNFIVLNFDGADLQVVLQTISELVGINYILGPKIKGKITIQTYKKIPRKDLTEVLYSILEVNGFTTVKSGHYIKIVPITSAKQYPIETKVGKDESQISTEDVVITQIISLEYIAVDEVAAILRPLISRSGSLITHKNTNLMILCDTSANIKRLMKIINMLDLPTQLEIGEKVFVYYVENGDSEVLAGILNKIYGKKSKKKDITRVIQPGKKKTSRRARTPKRQVIKTGGEGIATGLAGEINIVAAKEINALIIKSSPRNYSVIKELLKKLDIMPKQVLIEVLIADITLNDDFQFGLEWWAANQASKIGGHKPATPFGQLTTFSPIGAPAGALSYILDQGALFKSTIAIQASKGNVNILSSPHILTTDNQEASISIVDQIPIIKTFSDSTTTGGTTTSVEFKDAGITLKVTPKINEKGLVSMKITLEVSDVGPQVETTQGKQTSFIKRNAQTSVVVQNGQTLVIGGLIRENQSENRVGIPFLMDIPVIGYLFGSDTKSVNKTELVMLITPHVVTSRQEVDELTDKFKTNVKDLREIMGKEVD